MVLRTHINFSVDYKFDKPVKELLLTLYNFNLKVSYFIWKNKMCIVSDYLAYTKQYTSTYGEKTLVLMQVGSFYEAYGLRLPGENTTIVGSNVVEFAKLNGMAIADKTHLFEGQYIVVMAGVGTAHIDGYLKTMVLQGYTVVIYKQDFNAKGTTRSLLEIVSPGTYFALDDNHVLSNNFMCIWLIGPNRHRFLTHVGISIIDVCTGKTSLYEFVVEPGSQYDELERYVSAYSPNECLLITQFMSEKMINNIQDMVGLRNGLKLHKTDLSVALSATSATTSGATSKSANKLTDRAKKAEQQVYQVEVLKQYFPTTFSLYDQLREHSVALQAFCLLLDFVFQHQPALVKKLASPAFENLSDKMMLANHSLRQLNILDDHNAVSSGGKLRSVSSFLNECKTAMGKRSLLYALQNPTTNVKQLLESYSLTAATLLNNEWRLMREQLNGISDWEKMLRKMVLKKMTPTDFRILAKDLLVIEEMLKKKDIKTKHIVAEIYRVINADASSPYYICGGVERGLDELLQACVDGKEQLEAIRLYLSTVATTTTAKKKPSENNFIKIHETSKREALLQCTTLRVATLKAQLQKHETNCVVQLQYQSPFTKKVETYMFDLDKLEYVAAASKNDVVITSAQIKQISTANLNSGEQVIKEMDRILVEFTQNFLMQFEDELLQLCREVTATDLLQCKCYIAHTHNYCRPTIVAGSKAQLSFTGLRHPLIENMLTQEIYVRNDLDLQYGLLLFGTNAVGKTSFIRAVGIALILAQAGFYVPCTTFTFTPYKALFTRILGADNLFKGLSTFEVEMTELRTILALADQDSLVLGDEVCSGTENKSALSIFTATLEDLHAKQSTFLFATHFHEIVHYEEIKALFNLKIMHMAVHYDYSVKQLFYDRRLQAGVGDELYGLEVCKSLNLKPAFLERAHEIRQKYDVSSAAVTNVLDRTSTKYNAKKLAGGLCEICRENNSTETHHLQHQLSANPHNSFIAESFHKNHAANLVRICELCHLQLHNTKQEHKVVLTVDGHYIIVPICVVKTI
jgi:DNA mismatch repair protein MutS